MVKLALEMDIPTYQYVYNTSLEALAAPFWREVPHGLQYYLLTGAPFMDPGENIQVDWIYLEYPTNIYCLRLSWLYVPVIKEHNLKSDMILKCNSFCKACC